MSQINNDNPEPAQATSVWGPLRASFVVVLMCASLIVGVTYRAHLDHRGIVIPPHQLGGAIAQNTIDPDQIPLMTYYEKIEEMLKAKYVDPVTDENGLALGAVQGMVAFLNDGNSNFLNPQMTKAYLARQSGTYVAAGVDIETLQPKGQVLLDDSLLHPTSDVQVGRFPDLIIQSVIPGGAAARAGLEVGDQINSIDGHWVVNQAPLIELESLVKSAKKAKDIAAKFNEKLAQLRDLADHSMTPYRAWELLETQTTGQLTVGVLRKGVVVTKTLDMSLNASIANGVESTANGKVVRLRFAPGAAAFLKSQLSSGDLTLDLTNQPSGSFPEMKECLALLLPSGNYGSFLDKRDGASSPLNIVGTPYNGKLTLLVNSATRGAAKIFALALEHAGKAVTVGPMDDTTLAHSVVVQNLVNGASYTLAVGEYRPAGPLKPQVVSIDLLKVGGKK